jgi:integrase/recombinase XerD
LKAVTRRALKAYREIVPHKKTDPVWWAKNGPLSYDGLYKIFKRLAEKVDLGDEAFNPHAWRHAFGRDTTKAGIPTAQLQDLLGHSSIEVTKIYAQFNDSELQEAHHRYSPADEDIDVSPPVDPDSDEKSGKK